MFSKSVCIVSVEELAEQDPVEALALAERITSMRELRDARTEILEVWDRNDPVAALA